MEHHVGSLQPYVDVGEAGMRGVLAGRDKGSACAPKHGQRSRVWIELHAAHRSGGGGERSRSCAAESRSTTCMVPPQTGQFQTGSGCSVDGDAGGAAVFSELPRSRKHSGNRVARLRLARNPKLRMRTKPGGSTWSRKRRRNSSTARVMSRFLLPWAESRQRKVMLPSESATSLELEMATRWVYAPR